jgi:uncharacterized protein (TIGR01777 family)
VKVVEVVFVLDEPSSDEMPDRTTAVVTGSSGFIGSALVRRLEGEGHDVVRLLRPGSADRTHQAGPSAGRVRTSLWDPSRGILDPAVLEGAGAVVHLAGASVGARPWTRAYKEMILRSRVESTRLLAEALVRCRERPSVLVSASAIGWYGDRGDEVLTEESPGGEGFRADVCRAWEAEALAAAEAGARVVVVRLGIVLGRSGGLLPVLLVPARLGIGTRLGDGAQFVSWVSLEDAVRAILRAIADRSLDGPVNVTAPEPVTDQELAAALSRAVRRPRIGWAPRWALEVLAGRERAGEVLLSSQRVLPAKLLAAGFTFEHPHLDMALAAALGREVSPRLAGSRKSRAQPRGPR